jgi:4-amino-4-deoxy-L-arabinose transferase-like glycosyltransferase
MTPYKDFFEHNTPLLQFITAPLFALVHDQREYVRVIPTLFRTISLIFSLMTVAVVWSIGNRIGGPRIALLASVLILSSALFLTVGIEFRPDTVAALMMMVAVYAVLRAIDAPRVGGASALWLGLAGVALDASVMSTQKVLFAGPGMIIAFAVLMVPRFGIFGTLRRAGWASLGFAVGIALLIVFFASRGAIWEFFHSNVYLNANWPWPGLEPAR